MPPFVQGYVLAVIFFASIIGGIIYLGSRDTEHPQTHPR